MPRRPLFVAAALAAATLVLPAAAGAATVTVTGDSGESVALTSGATPQLRNMSPVIAATLDPSDKRFGMKILAPDGTTDAGLEQGCRDATDAALAQTLRYQGNGTYTVRVVTSADENDISCEQAQTQTFTFAVNASTTLTGPGAQVLLRKQGSDSGDRIAYPLTFAQNPGVAAYALYYSTAATIAPDGSLITNELSEDTADIATGVDTFEFSGPGDYTFVGRLLAGDGGSPFTAPLKIRVVSPFDFSTVPYFADSRGPKYEVRGILGDQRSAEGKRLVVSIAKGKKGGKFKPLAKPKIGGAGEFGFKFKLKGRGRYRLRYVFKGAEFILPGSFTQKATFKRV
jgi:hypothetical protein